MIRTRHGTPSTEGQIVHFTDENLDDIFDSTSGKCHICGKQLARSNRGAHGARGAWHVDHSLPRARGGSDALRNLKPACIRCNCSKQDGCNQSARARHGRSRAPLSRKRRAEVRNRNGIVGVGVGWVVARLMFRLAPGPALLVGLVGLAVARRLDPDWTR